MKFHTNLVKPGAVEAKKHLGQHFLKDAGVLDRIVRWIAPCRDQVFIEIGAGTGALSVRLAEKAGALAAVEFDGDCVGALTETLAPFDSAAVVHADILSLDLAGLAGKYTRPGQSLRVAGNLPYNIGTAIIGKLLRVDFRIEAMFFMLQLEVAERILAQPGTREYGYFSVLCQHHAKARMGFKVSPACFAPKPKVMSAVISLYPEPREKNAEREAGFEELAKACFAYRRKTLANSLSQNARFGGIAAGLLEKADIDGARRAESLSVMEYEHLADIYLREYSPGKR
ncbi:MAG: 16S rRNA (adenine(1518)-N(6)/adenine(1519)-N(6))-dimethyltransferase RsmA [Acidobacteriota bacterium]|jgi:16S rRNA (adenine1518-N6/adenine1519-N6)-dimethyltransferase|nr:16S rRNA (adenine(1518)-N(6)/adenine(1519)-N(6))-dimethyltransferase RsmA [Acidobacteriota bacterium]